MSPVGELDLRARVREIANRWPAVGLVVGVIGPGSHPSFHAEGLADVAKHIPVAENTVFRIASITKTFTAVAVLQLWERGLINLDAPANDYLRSYQLIPANPAWPPATVRHLLTHTAGIQKLARPLRALRSGWFGESVGLDEPVPTLEEFYGGHLRLVAEPGRTYNYTDHSFSTAGQIVEDVSGQPLHRYFREHIFDPLGMGDSDLLRSERLTARLATGYRLRSQGAKPVTDRHWVTSAASSIYSTPRDMARYASALLGGGATEHGTVLRPDTVATMFAPHYQTDPRLPGMGLGFPRVDLGGHLAVEHQGVLPGFNSQIFLAPQDGVGVIGFTTGARQATIWLTFEMQRLLGDLIGAREGLIRADVPNHPEVWGDLCGWYRPRAQLNDMQAWAFLGAGLGVSVRSGRLMIRALSPIPALYHGFVLHPDDDIDPYAFRIDLTPFDMGTSRVVFSHDPQSATARVHLDLIPLTAEKPSRG